MLVGVVIPVRDGERHLDAAIESVLSQTHQAFDIVVVDDGSTDASRDIARSYGPDVRCIALPHRGLGPTRNAGVEAVRGDFVAFIDHDDLWPKRKLEAQLVPFHSSSPPDLVFGHAREFVSPDVDPAHSRRVRCVPELRPAALPGSLLATRAAMSRVGPFPTRWVSNDFLAWLLAARRLGLREVMVGEHVLSRRLHDSNLSRRAAMTRTEYLHVLKESLDRRRADAPEAQHSTPDAGRQAR